MSRGPLQPLGRVTPGGGGVTQRESGTRRPGASIRSSRSTSETSGSPAAAAAVTGHLADVRELTAETAE